MYTLFELHHVSNSCFRTKNFRRWAAQLCWWIFYKAVIDRTRCWLYQRDPASRNTLSLQGIWNERLFIIALLDFLNAQSASISRKLTSSSCPWKRWRKILECQARISYRVLLLASFQDVWDLIFFLWLPSFVHDWVLCSCCESGIIFVMMMSKVFYDELKQKQKKEESSVHPGTRILHIIILVSQFFYIHLRRKLRLQNCTSQNKNLLGDIPSL